jgi:acetyltransferase-like isoleucine patch superfamily enzyme
MPKDTKSNRTILPKLISLATERPSEILPGIRSAILFYFTYYSLKLLKKRNCILGRNTRLQRRGSIKVQYPNSYVTIGNNSIIYEDNIIEAYGTGSIQIGNNSILGGCKIYSKERINIGDNFLASWNVFIQDYDPHPISPESRKKQIDEMCQNFFPNFESAASNEGNKIQPQEISSKTIEIGNNVWVGANASILKGAVIGNNCIVATGAVVTAGKYQDNSLLAGVPAKVVKIILS